MENNLYFLRHCKTINNIEKRITGQQNISILRGGEIETNQISQCSNMTILSSPLIRCRETVDLFVNNLGGVSEINFCEELIERNMGIFEGMLRENAAQEFPQYFIQNSFIYTMTPPSGESYAHIYHRANNFVKELLQHKLEKSNVLICSHNHILKIIYCIILQIPIEEYWYTISFGEGKVNKII